MKRYFFLLFSAVILSACTEYGRPGSPVWFNKAPPEVVAAHYQGICSGYGYQAGTDQMRDCIAAESRAGRGVASNQAVAGTISAASVQSTVTQ